MKRSACRIHTNKAGGVTIYLKREFAEEIMKKFKAKSDYMATFDGKKIIIGEM